MCFLVYFGEGLHDVLNYDFSLPGIPTGFASSRIANFAGVPDMVVPSECYQTKVSN